MKKIAPKIINSHEWISLVLNKNRLTVSYSGAKAVGFIPAEIFALWCDATDFGTSVKKQNALVKLGLDPKNPPKIGEVVETFAKKIDTIWPEWSKEPYMPKVGDTITVNFGKRHGLESAVAEEVKRNYVTANFPRRGRTSVHFAMIVK